ncbi:hypothetical protein [Desulfopila sp. IMCC35008]|uniref:hypothetical protein n=1 Tax=Desulfopila sp. IMCC35008 TaxID=2653858 RepID=UPI0013D6BF44|nr:hypothetical protein [Desulfopila sp. IMCC35008]
MPSRIKRSGYTFLPYCLLTVSILLLLGGCTSEKERTFGSCVTCHEQDHTGSSHEFECTSCHGGDSTQDRLELAHIQLIPYPAHPDHMESSCGQCHDKEYRGVAQSPHLTLKNKVNLIRKTYGATEDLPSLTDVPVHEDPANSLELIDDMLRRRCLSCHLYYPGESYPATIHGTGCAACHLGYKDKELADHKFLDQPTDEQCLSCHYGNYVGADYYGRYEHDLNIEYRTPYYTNRNSRPYGVEYHQLVPDIHHQRGMECIDCHSGVELMKSGSNQPVTCESCHDGKKLELHLPQGVSGENGTFTYTSRRSGNLHPLPLMSHPAHKFNNRVQCQVCHAQWAFNDSTTHLLRSDLDDYENWDRLTVQGSAELEQLLEHNLDYANEELPPTMADKITGDILPGIWYKGYSTRRWEEVLTGIDESNRLVVMRPILNYSLSWIDEDETIRYDSLTTPAPDGGMRPYTPHTTGPAGLFYEQRIRNFLGRGISNTSQEQ